MTQKEQAKRQVAPTNSIDEQETRDHRNKRHKQSSRNYSKPVGLKYFPGFQNILPVSFHHIQSQAFSYFKRRENILGMIEKKPHNFFWRNKIPVLLCHISHAEDRESVLMGNDNNEGPCCSKSIGESECSLCAWAVNFNMHDCIQTYHWKTCAGQSRNKAQMRMICLKEAKASSEQWSSNVW